VFKDTSTHLDFSCEEAPARPLGLGAAQFWIRRALDAEGSGISKYGLRLWGSQGQGSLGAFYHFETNQADLLALTDAQPTVRQAVNQTIRPLLIDAEALDARWLGELHLKARQSRLETSVLFATTIIVLDLNPRAV